MIAPLCQICATTVCGVEFTNGKRPGVRSADRILADPARARGNFGPSRSVGGGACRSRRGRATDAERQRHRRQRRKLGKRVYHIERHLRVVICYHT